MPIYDYKCSKCEHQIEVIQKVNDKPKTFCTKCKNESLKKLVSAPSFKTGKKKNISTNEAANTDKIKKTSKPTSNESSKQDKIKD